MADRKAKNPFDGKDMAKTPRQRLDTMQKVRLEMASIYFQARDGKRDVQDASRLANILSLIGRIIEGGELEQRLEALEKAAGQGPQP